MHNTLTCLTNLGLEQLQQTLIQLYHDLSWLKRNMPAMTVTLHASCCIVAPMLDTACRVFASCTSAQPDLCMKGLQTGIELDGTVAYIGSHLRKQ